MSEINSRSDVDIFKGVKEGDTVTVTYTAKVTHKAGDHYAVVGSLGLNGYDFEGDLEVVVQPSPPLYETPRPVRRGVDYSKEHWNARANLMDAAHLLDSACSWAEKNEALLDRLGEFDWQGIAASLDEVAAELRAAGEFITSPPKQPWEEEQHLCGYSVYMGQRDTCYHEGCWAEQSFIEMAAAMKNSAQEMLGNFVVDEADTDESEFSRGYDAAIEDLETWHRWWTWYHGSNKEYQALTDEERERISSVVYNGGKFEDFIAREVFFIKEGWK